MDGCLVVYVRPSIPSAGRSVGQAKHGRTNEKIGFLILIFSLNLERIPRTPRTYVCTLLVYTHPV